MTEPRTSRKAANQTQTQAAETVGVTRITWTRWECSVTAMPASTLRLYRHLCGLQKVPFGDAIVPQDAPAVVDLAPVD